MPRQRKGRKKAKNEPRPVKAEPLVDEVDFESLMKIIERSTVEDKVDPMELSCERLREIGVTEEQVEELMRNVGSDELSKSRGAIRALGYLKRNPAKVLYECLDVEELRAETVYALGRIGNLRDVNILAHIGFDAMGERHRGPYDGIYVPVAHALGSIGDKQAVEALKGMLRKARRLGIDSKEIEGSLEGCGLSSGEIERIRHYHDKKKESHFKRTEQQLAYELICKGDAKRIVFEDAKVLEALQDRQTWITINDPELAKKALGLALDVPKKRGALDNALKAALGVRSKELEEGHFTYYADEILDAISQVFGQMKSIDPELAAVLSEIRYCEGTKLRYVKREESDLRLGDKCGDCTATGSIHYGDSVMWLVNPAYQILKMSKGKRFLGKMSFTLGNINGEDAIIIDALEFNPQAIKGKPYYDDGLECLEEALGFLKELATREERSLYALTTSNSSGAVQLLESRGVPVKSHYVSEKLDLYEEETPDDEGRVTVEKVEVMILVPSKDIRRILPGVPEDQIRLYYQMLEEERIGESGSRDLLTDKLPALETEVINPAQMEDEDVAAAMRARDFQEASRLILADERWAGRIKRIFDVPFAISPVFLSKRLEMIYRAESVDIDRLKRTFIVAAKSFVKLS